MKKLIMACAALLCATAISLNAAEKDKEKAKLTQEQKALRKEIASKYDANKDGKLDKEERAKISDDDKVKLKKAGLAPGHKAPPKKD